MQSNEITSKRNLRVREFCDVFGMRKSKFYLLVQAGELKTVKLGGTTLITNAEVERFQNQLEGVE